MTPRELSLSSPFFRLTAIPFYVLQMTLQVSWVRHRDVHLLTIGRYTYTNDQRFRAIHNAHSDDWTLQIKYPQHRDSGIYECQVSTTPHMSHLVHLNVIGESSFIVSHYSKRTRGKLRAFKETRSKSSLAEPVLPLIAMSSSCT